MRGRSLAVGLLAALLAVLLPAAARGETVVLADVAEHRLVLVWPSHLPAKTWFPIFLTQVSCLAALLLIRSLLETRQRVPRLDVALCLVAAYFAASVVLVPFFHDVLTLPHFFALAGVVVLPLPVSVAVLWQGYRPARYYAASAFLNVVASTTYLFVTLGLLPKALIADAAVQIVLATQLFLVSLAIAEQLRGLRRESERLQATLLAEQEDALVVKDELKGQLEDALVRLEERHRELERFYLSISTDIRKPLAALKDFLHLLDRDVRGRDVAALHRDAAKIHEVTDTLSDLMDEILAHSGRRPDP